jgi:HEAT repeat protein
MTHRVTFAAVLVGLWLGAGAASAQISREWQDVIRLLRHPDAGTRLVAVRRLTNAGFVAAAEPVAAVLTDPDDRVQLAAIEAELAFFQSDRLGGGGLFGRGSSDSAAQAAFEAGPLLRGAWPVPGVVLDQLLLATRDANARVRFDAIHAFGFLAEAPLAADTVKRLALELDHYDPIIRAATARVIGRLRAEAAAEAVAVALVDSNDVVRLYATETIGLIRDTKSLATLRDQFTRARGDMIGVTFLAIGRIGSRDDLELFRQRIADRAPAMRRAAVEGLSRIDDRDALPAIESLLKNDRDNEVRLAAACGLQRMGQQQTHVIAPMLVLRDVNAAARDCLFEIGPPAVPGIIATLGVATDSRHRADLVQLVGYLGGPIEVGFIEPLAADPDERVRRAVGHAIARLRR